MNSVTDKSRDARTDAIDRLRRFHYGEPAAAAATTAPAAGMLPALLQPYRDASTIRYAYPLYLAPLAADGPLAVSLSAHLEQSVDRFAPGDGDARILKDNLPWLERYLRQHIDGPNPVDAAALFDEATAALLAHLDLKQDSRDVLEADIASLRAAIHDGGRFLAYGPDAALHLLVRAVRQRDERLHAGLRGDIDRKARGLEALLQVEDAKNDGSSGNGAAARHLDTDKLTTLLETRARGSVTMPADRRARIETALGVLRSWDGDAIRMRMIGNVENPWFEKQVFIDVAASTDPCTDARRAFEQEALRYAALFAALRIAALEIEDDYDAAIHDSWFAEFDWRAFADEELQLVTRVVALASADHLAGDGLPAFSHLLGSRLPVHVVSWVRACDNPGVRPGEGPFDGYRFELAYFGIGHRQAVVAQTSAARFEDLLAGFLCGLDSNRTSVHLVNRGTQTLSERPVLDPWFVASAALESRAHPFVLINPGGGDRAAERVSFGGNPQADKDWPVEPFAQAGPGDERSETELAFTFADYALLMPALHEHFRTVPADCASDDLVPIADYLGKDDASIERLVPYVLGVDGEGAVSRLVVSRALVFACRDRLNYWRSLQELAGIHNVYVEAAIERVLDDARAAAETERGELLKTHEKELEDVRSEAAGEAMGQLVDVLMGADLSSMVETAAPAPAAERAQEVPAETAEAEPEPEPVEEDEDVSFDDPWLDTAACTTCDDCMGINKMMFAYNDDKQAILKDPGAGPYSDLVRAAEICPAQCIHPGKPLNPNEPGLEELIARAAPFN